MLTKMSSTTTAALAAPSGFSPTSRARNPRAARPPRDCAPAARRKRLAGLVRPTSLMPLPHYWYRTRGSRET